MKKIFKFGKDQLNASIALAIAEGKIPLEVDEATRINIRKSSEYVAQFVASGKAVYGINTGFGPLCTTMITAKETETLQRNILISHAVGVGKPIDKMLSKLMLILKVHALCFGYSGVQEKTIDRILWLIENNQLPVVPSQGSVGASGDLAPLAHLFLPLIGEGFVWKDDEMISSSDMLEHHQLKP
ncbi:MAG TPA: aromatic amino acid lyase, partial [Niabella sp.]|nr:aromatic amino acid lyase [Niabella sp.]